MLQAFRDVGGRKAVMKQILAPKVITLSLFSILVPLSLWSACSKESYMSSAASVAEATSSTSSNDYDSWGSQHTTTALNASLSVKLPQIRERTRQNKVIYPTSATNRRNLAFQTASARRKYYRQRMQQQQQIDGSFAHEHSSTTSDAYQHLVPAMESHGNQSVQILILSAGRSGSTFFSEVMDVNDKVLYFYEV